MPFFAARTRAYLKDLSEHEGRTPKDASTSIPRLLILRLCCVLAGLEGWIELQRRHDVAHADGTGMAELTGRRAHR